MRGFHRRRGAGGLPAQRRLQWAHPGRGRLFPADRPSWPSVVDGVGYLRPARRRPNLTIASNALVSRILFSGRRAIGIEYRQGDATRVAHANVEVIVAGGTFNSPQLLQLSGVGPAALLQ